MVDRVRKILTALILAEDLDSFIADAPRGWRIYRLSGNRQDEWSVSVSGNWRIAFEEENGPHRPFEPGELPPMATGGIEVNMTPSHPGGFIRTEVI